MDPRTRSSSAGLARFTAALIAAAAFSLLIVFAAACGGDDSDEGGGANGGGSVGQVVQVAGGSFVRVTPAELQTMLQSKDFPFINVHIPFEGEIEGTDQHLLLTRSAAAGRPARRQGRKDCPLLPQRQHGTTGRRELVQAGYTNVWELGGMIAWKEAGLPLLPKDDRLPDSGHHDRAGRLPRGPRLHLVARAILADAADVFRSRYRQILPDTEMPDISFAIADRSTLRHAILLSSENLRLDDEELPPGGQRFPWGGWRPIVETRSPAFVCLRMSSP
jgi:hypothetical protein